MDIVTVCPVRFEHYREPIGISESAPRLSWRFVGEVTNWTQLQSQVHITFDAEPTQCFSFQNSHSVLVPWPARALRSSESATVCVRALGSDGRWTAWSEESSVTAGLLSRDDWKAELIEAPPFSCPSGPKQPILFRRRFVVHNRVKKAWLYATAHGVYEASVNGEKVGDHILDPGWSSYNHRLPYQTFDITKQLQEGENVVGAMVGEGWWAGRLGIHGGTRNIWGEDLGFIAQIQLSFEDGPTEYVATDQEWTASVGGLITSEIYNGELYDARREPQGWAKPGFEPEVGAEAWASVKTTSLESLAATLVVSQAPPVRRVQEVEAVAVFRSPSGKVLVDFGQNLVGWLRVAVQGPEGHTITFQHVEVLEHGEAGTRPLWGADAKDTLILSSRAELWEPTFTYHGFRYVEVTGWPTTDGMPALQDLTAIVIHTDLEKTGHFSCSEPLLNKLHQNIVWSMRGNFLSIPSDCPQRGERLGWTGDIQAFGPTATYLYESSGFLSDWLKDLALEQHEDGGVVPPLVVPDVLCKMPVFKTRAKKAQAIWGDVAVSLPWDLYSASGDSAILSQQYESMQSWMDRGIPRKSNGLWDTSNHPQLADWLDPSAPPDDPGNGVTDGELVANSFLIGMTDLMARISAVLSKPCELKRYNEAAASLRIEFQKEYITQNGRIACDTQTALSLPIHFSLFSSDAQKLHAGKRLVEVIRSKARFKITTGFAGTPLVGHALTAVGESQNFYRMLLHRKNPSWLYPVTMGATTMWERWDSMLPDGSINPGMMTSFNHYALGSIGDWMHKVIGGLRCDEPGWRRVRIAPIPGGGISFAKTSFNSPYGLVSSDWHIEGDVFVLVVKVPPNTFATVKLPSDATEEEMEVGSGTHRFQCSYLMLEWPPKPTYGAFYRNAGDDDEL